MEVIFKVRWPYRGLTSCFSIVVWHLGTFYSILLKSIKESGRGRDKAGRNFQKKVTLSKKNINWNNENQKSNGLLIDDGIFEYSSIHSNWAASASKNRFSCGRWAVLLINNKKHGEEKHMTEEWDKEKQETSSNWWQLISRWFTDNSSRKLTRPTGSHRKIWKNIVCGLLKLWKGSKLL